jgi:glutamine cyclotransferase
MFCFVLRRFCASFALAALVLSIAAAAPTMGYKIVARYPHSTESYTEGFLYLDGLFYEGTGIAGHSALLAIEPETGKPVQKRELAPQYFGEGIVDWGPDIYQWTWKSQICFVYDRFSLRPVKQFSYSGEGWGMTRTARELITSDGSATLRFRDPETFRETHHIVVKDGPKIIEELNELEFIKGEIYANVWHSDVIARINPRDGHVVAWIDLSGLLPPDQMVNEESVLNGIAYDARRDRLFVTGKQWPAIFEIKVVPRHGKMTGHAQDQPGPDGTMTGAPGSPQRTWAGNGGRSPSNALWKFPPRKGKALENILFRPPALRRGAPLGMRD